MNKPPVDADAFNAFEAAGWEQQVSGYEDFFEPITTRLVGPLLDAAEVDRGTRVLDVASGPGHVAAAAAERGAFVIGVDIAEGMLSLAAPAPSPARLPFRRCRGAPVRRRVVRRRRRELRPAAHRAPGAGGRRVRARPRRRRPRRAHGLGLPGPGAVSRRAPRRRGGGGSRFAAGHAGRSAALPLLGRAGARRPAAGAGTRGHRREDRRVLARRALGGRVVAWTARRDRPALRDHRPADAGRAAADTRSVRSDRSAARGRRRAGASGLREARVRPQAEVARTAAAPAYLPG